MSDMKLQFLTANLSQTFLPNRVLKYKASNLLLPWLKCDIMSVTFNSTGTKLCVLQKSEPPKMYSTFSSEPVVTCVDNQETYK